MGLAAGGKALAFELKLTVIVAIYAIYKVVHDTGVLQVVPYWRGYDLFTLANRVVYVLGHVLLYQHYNIISADILANTKMNTSSKLSKRGYVHIPSLTTYFDAHLHMFIDIPT